MEDATEGIIVKDIFSSYSRPIHDPKGNSVGTFSVDIRLAWFTEMIAQMKPYPHSFCVMLGKGGSYLVHPDTTKLFYETIFTRTLEKPDSCSEKEVLISYTPTPPNCSMRPSSPAHLKSPTR